MKQEENILFISLTCEVLKLDKFNEFNDEQKENILFISLTCEVLKLDKFNEFNDEQKRKHTIHRYNLWSIKIW